MRASLLGAFAVCSLAGAVARAEVVFDSTLGAPGPAPAGVIGTTAVDYLIEPERGQLRGGNLFFSFDRFSIESGRIGAFNGPAGIENVLARVTGGDLSRIDGLLGSAITGADVWLINPSGVVFGAGSRLVVRGGLQVSTADYVRLADGTRFSARELGAGELSVAAPEAFGFFTRDPASIDVDASGEGFQTGRGNRLALVGGDVSLHAGTDGRTGFAWAQSADIDLVAVAGDGISPVEVRLRDSEGANSLEVSGPWSGRDLRIEDDVVLSSSGLNPADIGRPSTDGAGDIRIFGDSLLIDDSELRSPTVGALRGGDIDISLSGDFMIRSRAGSHAEVRAGTGFTQGIFSAFGTGDGGDLSIDAENISVLDGAIVSTTSFGPGAAGTISLRARDTIRVAGESSDDVIALVRSGTQLSGAGGRIFVDAPRLELENRGAIVTEARTNSSGGSIDIDVDTLLLRSGGRIDSSVRSFVGGDDTGGTIHIRASRKITISGRESDDVFSGITAIAQGATEELPASTARAGDITVQTPRLRINDGGTISTQSLGTGDGGSIEIWTNDLALNRGRISASALEGQGGDVSIHANRRVALRNGSEIEARAEGAGDAGTIAIDAGRELVLEDSAITTESELSDGGEVTIRARELVALERSEITTSVTGGTGGNITIDPEHVVLNASQIVARAGAGTGGNIRIVAGQFLADVDSAVDASSETGIDGTVQITSPDVDLTGTLDVLPSEFADAAGLMRQACATRRAERAGSFVVATSGRASASPDAPLPAHARSEDDERNEQGGCR